MNNNIHDPFFEANKDGWNKRTAVHIASSFYDNQTFKAGKNSLNKPELEELGSVEGKSLLHLQCHFGQDTLSWARLGAKVTGIDLSDLAIAEAKKLSAEINTPATFVCSNVYDLVGHPEMPEAGSYDVVFTSYGTIGWLPDLDKWAAVISHFLKPGGIFYIIDFHPVLWMMDDDLSTIKYPYHNFGVIAETNTGTYTDRDAAIEYKEYSWNHSISEILNALIDAGLEVQRFNEFSYSPYNCFNNVVQGADGMWRVKGMEDMIPMMYSVKAGKVE
ncbi:MAG: class I SAM-dependent methyltransferase [Bacteroidota bacterium]